MNARVKSVYHIMLDWSFGADVLYHVNNPNAYDKQFSALYNNDFTPFNDVGELCKHLLGLKNE